MKLFTELFTGMNARLRDFDDYTLTHCINVSADTLTHTTPIRGIVCVCQSLSAVGGRKSESVNVKVSEEKFYLDTSSECSRCGRAKDGVRTSMGSIFRTCTHCDRERTRKAVAKTRHDIMPSGLTRKQEEQKRRSEKLGRVYQPRKGTAYGVKDTIERSIAAIAKEYESDVAKLRQLDNAWVRHKEANAYLVSKAKAWRGKAARHRELKTNYYLSKCIRSRIYRVLMGQLKSAPTLELLGCTIAEFRAHLESRFTDGMTWENYGTHWHIDHKRPCASFDLSQPEQQRQCFHYSNMQPLGASQNISKGSRWNGVRLRISTQKVTRVLIEPTKRG